MKNKKIIVINIFLILLIFFYSIIFQEDININIEIKLFMKMGVLIR